MPLANIDSLLQPVSADAPCGADLEYDPAFLELDRLSESKPEQQMGSTIVPAQEPDWKEVGNRALLFDQHVTEESGRLFDHCLWRLRSSGRHVNMKLKATSPF